MNKLIITGNLVRDTEITYLQNGIQMGKNTIASNKYYKKNGNTEVKTCFIDFIVFGKTAEVLQKYTKKGNKILAEGSLDYNTWIDKNGFHRSKFILQIERIELLDYKIENKNNKQSPTQQQTYQTQHNPHNNIRN